MTFDDRVQGVAKKGFTERQARFLTIVMLHAGVCVPRQYARFCGIVHGAKTRKFFTKLVRLGLASRYDCRHNRAQIYHVNGRALYAAIGDAESRLRKPVTLNHAIQRLMVLDAVVEDADLIWLGTAEEKAVHLTTATRIDPKDLPHEVVGEGGKVRVFPDRLPIGIHLAGRGVVVYVVTDPWLDEFRLFLERHAALLRAFPAWTLRIIVPPQWPDAAQRSKLAVWDQLLTPLPDEKLKELRWYFEQLRTHPTSSRGDELDGRFRKAWAAFSGPRFKALYRAWRQDGEGALASAHSQALSDAVQAGAGRVETLELGHRYGHLSPGGCLLIHLLKSLVRSRGPVAPKRHPMSNNGVPTLLRRILREFWHSSGRSGQPESEGTQLGARLAEQMSQDSLARRCPQTIDRTCSSASTHLDKRGSMWVRSVA